MIEQTSAYILENYQSKALKLREKEDRGKGQGTTNMS